MGIIAFKTIDNSMEDINNKTKKITISISYKNYGV